jgi:hypothetical protein
MEQTPSWETNRFAASQETPRISAQRLSEHIGAVYVCTRESSWNPNSNTMVHYQTQYDRPSVCVIAHQYSSAILGSLLLTSLKENFGALKFFLFFKYRLNLEMRNFQLRKPRGVCIHLQLFGLC